MREALGESSIAVMDRPWSGFFLGEPGLHFSIRFELAIPLSAPHPTVRSLTLLVAVVGSVQALVLGGALLARPVHRHANRVLAALLVAMALFLGLGAYQISGQVARWPHLVGWSHPIPLVFGPLLYLYALLVTHGDRRLQWRDAWHLLPFAILVGWAMPFYLLPASEKRALFQAIASLDTPSPWRDHLAATVWMKLASGITYTAMTVRLAVRHRQRIRTQYSSLDRVSLDWLLMLAFFSTVVWAIALAAQFLEPSDIVRPGTDDALITILLALAAYAVGYRGLQQVAVPSPASPSPDPTVPLPEGFSTELSGTPPRTPLDRASLSVGMVTAIEQRLRVAMERDELWRQPELTLSELADRVGTSTHKLSAVLNSQVEQSFYDYVNGFRVREVQRQLLLPHNDARTVLALAIDAGFASKSTFNAVFRRQVGTTPSAWRAAQQPPERAAPDASAVRTDPSVRPAG